MNAFSVKKEELFNVPIPQKTDSYTPVPNRDLILAIEEVLDNYGYNTIAEHYELGGKGQQMFGYKTLVSPSYNGDGEQQRTLGFRNSYNKSLAVGIVSGSRVIVCSNLMFEGDIVKLRKHTTNVFADLYNMIVDAILGIEINFEKLLKDTERLKSCEISKTDMAELLGKMFIEEELITSTQLNHIKNSWKEKGEEHMTGWDFMNYCTDSMKVLHPSTRIDSQLKVHNYIDTTFKA